MKPSGLFTKAWPEKNSSGGGKVPGTEPGIEVHKTITIFADVEI